MVLIKLFLIFAKIGAFTFGGGYAMVAMMQAEAARHGWLTEEELINFVAVSESTPGPLAVNMATFVGTKMGGLLGACLATLGVVLPSFIVILIVARCYDKFRSSKAVNGAMSGLKPAVIGMIATAFLSMLITVFFPNGLQVKAFTDASFWLSLGIFSLCAVLVFKKVNPIKLIVLAAAIGIGAGYGLGL